MVEQELTSNRIAEELFRLPTLPGIAVRILTAVSDDSFGFRDLKEIISSDAALSARVLQAANSPFYGRSGSIASLGQAVALLGYNEVKNLALGFSLINSFSRRKKGALDHVRFWKASLIGAATAELIARRIVPEEADNAFSLGLIQNIGTLLMACAFPERYDAVSKAAEELAEPLQRAEMRLLGIDHQEVGRRLLESWGLPAHMAAAIAGHHLPPDGCPPPERLGPLTQVMILSALFVDRLIGPAGSTPFASLARGIEAFGFAPRIDIHGVIAQTAEKAKQLFPVFELECDAEATIEILERAKSELSALTTHLIRQVRRQSVRLSELHEQVSTDDLTQIPNHRRLQELLHLEVERACRYRSPLAVVMIDIDHFKSVNDFFGHLAGDLLLRKVAVCLQDALRSSDQLARYGGEEFAVVMPETTLESAHQAAERLREAVAGLQVVYRGRPISVTVSLGVAALDPDHPMDAEALVRMADEALYTAKNSGRNRTCCYGWRTDDRQNGDPTTILVIDDEEVVLVTVTAMLDRLGYKVISAGNARSGVDLFVRNKDVIRLVVLDMVFPDMSAQELVTTIKSASPEVKILLSSGYPLNPRTDKALLDLSHGFLQKPYEISQLNGIIEKTLGCGGPGAGYASPCRSERLSAG
jgi:diguanylate cyclase (GGDEF)-like protein